MEGLRQLSEECRQPVLELARGHWGPRSHHDLGSRLRNDLFPVRRDELVQHWSSRMDDTVFPASARGCGRWAARQCQPARYEWPSSVVAGGDFKVISLCDPPEQALPRSDHIIEPRVNSCFSIDHPKGSVMATSGQYAVQL